MKEMKEKEMKDDTEMEEMEEMKEMKEEKELLWPVCARFAPPRQRDLSRRAVATGSGTAVPDDREERHCLSREGNGTHKPQAVA